MRNYHYYAEDMFVARQAEKEGDFQKAVNLYYVALRCAIWTLMLPLDSQPAIAANEGRFRCYRALRK